MSLQTPAVSVQKLQTALHAKAKADPAYRFYSLWDKVFREDVLREGWRRCRANGGAAGGDGVGFEDIESGGLDRWLGNLQQELRARQYRPQPLLRVWIPKSSGGQRPLGIPTIRDRVAQAALIVVLGPVFEADLLEEQYGFRRCDPVEKGPRLGLCLFELHVRRVSGAPLEDPRPQHLRTPAGRKASGVSCRTPLPGGRVAGDDPLPVGR